MTAQYAENLSYDGEEYAMCAEPLEMYFNLTSLHPPFQSTTTALWRGYIGSWEIVDNRLYLVKLTGSLTSGGDASLATLFPDNPERVFAHWFSGTIRLPQGKLLEYVHMGYSSVYERDVYLVVENGVVTKTDIKVNGQARTSDAPEGYGVGAWTTTPGNS